MANTFGALIVLSLLVEIAVDILKTGIPWIRGYKSQLTSIILGVLLTTLTSTGFLAMLDIQVSMPWLDWFLTGLIISRGSNFIHDLIARIKQF